jgi:putative tryptophan/tyrosine transport system substrate-binding protein
MRVRLGAVGVVAFVILGFCAATSVEAQGAGRTWRVGYLSLVEEQLETSRRWLAAFRAGLRELGYTEGENLVIEARYAAGRVDRLPGLAAELVRLKVDVLVAAPAGSALAAKKATSTVPIVFMGEPDPVGTGLVRSLARPGGNVTGLADAHSELAPKRLDLLRQLVPSASRVGVLWSPSNASTAPQVRTVESAARTLGLTVLRVPVEGPRRGDLDRAFAALARERVGALLVIADPTLGNQRGRIAELALAQRLATSGTHRGWAEAGLLMSYGTDFVDLFRHGAVLVDKILKGSPPSAIPVEQPTKFEFVINARTARALGLAIPPSVLLRADQVIE